MTDLQEQSQKWDQRFAGTEQPTPAAAVLELNLHLLPGSGRALDLACGTAGNGLLLAGLGFETDLWDISPVALELQQSWARERNLVVSVQHRDCERKPPAPGEFDVICVSHFLHRPLCAHLEEALAPGGVLFYQTFCADKLDPAGPSDPAFLLRPGELKELFPHLQLRFYREDGRCGDLARGERNRALLVAERGAIPTGNPDARPC